MAFEIFDTSKLRREAKTDVGQDGDEERRNNELKLKYKAVDPGPVDIFHYAFSHAGILTGLKDPAQELAMMVLYRAFLFIRSLLLVPDILRQLQFLLLLLGRL